MTRSAARPPGNARPGTQNRPIRAAASRWGGKGAVGYWVWLARQPAQPADPVWGKMGACLGWFGAGRAVATALLLHSPCVVRALVGQTLQLRANAPICVCCKMTCLWAFAAMLCI